MDFETGFDMLGINTENNKQSRRCFTKCKTSDRESMRNSEFLDV